MTKQKGLGAPASADAGGDQVRGEPLPDTTDGRTGPETLAAIGSHKLVAWERCFPPATGLMGIPTVLLPSDNLGGFAIYNLSEQFAELWPTPYLRRVRPSDFGELNAALPLAVALVRQHDRDGLVHRGLFPARSRSRLEPE